MLDSIIRFSIQNKLIIGIFTLALIVWGGYSLSRLPIDALPDITNNQVQVITQSPALSALDVERLISFPIEQTMATLPDLVEVRSISRFGLSVVTVVLKDGVDIYLARQQVFERLQQARSQIPANAGNPELAPVTTGLGEIYQYVIRAKPGFEQRYPAMELRSIQDWIVRRQLLGTKGVADVSSFGGFLKQYEVAVDPQRLRAAGVTMDELFTALEKNNQNAGGAYIDRRPNAYFIRSEGLIGTLQDIGKIVVRRSPNGIPVLVRDVAQVQLGQAVRYGAMTRNGDGEVVGAIVMMLKGANSSEVIGNVKQRIEQIKKSLPEGIEIHAFLDRTKLVNRAIGTVEKNLLEGALIVVFVLVLLLGNWRAGLVVASVIPLAMLFAVSLMNLFGVSGNLMSLGAIDFGLIVDGAVIIVEATLHHIALKQFRHNLSQDEMDEEVFVSASRIRSSAAFGEIIILIVYLPILALVGIEGKMFRPMAQTVAFAILGAFILSLTYVPMLSALLLSKKPIREGSKNISDRIMGFFHRGYDPAIRWTLNHKGLVVGLSVALFAATLWLFSTLGGEFIPQLDEGDFAVETRVMTGSSLAQSADASLQAGKVLKENFPEVIETIGKTGAGEIPTDPMPIEATDLMVILKDRSEWTSATSREELAEKMQEKLNQIPGVSFGFLQPIQMRFSELISGVKQDIAIKLYGEDLKVLADYAARIGRVVGTVPGAEDLYVEQVSGLPQIVVKFDRDALARFGLSIDDANRYLQAAFAGSAAGLVYEGERRYDLVVRLQQQSRQRLEDVQNLLISTVDDEQVPLSQVADVSFQNSVNQVQREDAKRRIIVAFNVRGRDVESVVKELQGKIDSQIKLPVGYYVTYGGQFQNLQEAKDRLSIAVPVALGLIFLLLFFTFGSVRQSLLIFSAIPLSAIGGVIALWLRDMPFSISAGVGFIALFGVAVLNGIVLIGEFNHLKDETDLDLRERILQGTATRLRPVMMTALVASLGFLPMALATTAGAEVQRPLATVVIGGLLSATLLTLLVLPCLYWWEQTKFGKKKPVVAPAPVVGKLATWLLIAGLVSGTVIHASAQVPQLAAGTPAFSSLSLEGALQQATTGNVTARINALNIAQQQTGRRAARDIGATNFSWTGGQYNGPNFDNNFTVSQNLPNPKLIRQLERVADANVVGSEAQGRVNLNGLRAQVKSAYYDLLYIAQRRRLLRTQDSLLVAFRAATELRLKTGEGTAVEVATATNQLGELRNALNQTDADRQIALSRLQTLLNTNQPVGLADSTLTRRALPLVTDSATLAQTPELAFLRQQTEIAARQTDVEQARLLPSFSLGYFNQSLKGTYTVDNQEVTYGGGRRFQGFIAGVSIPLFTRPQRARIEAARLGQQLGEATLVLTQRNLQGELNAVIQEVRKLQSSLSYYEQTGLPTARLLAEKATVAFRAGEIGYLNYSQALTQAYQTRAGYVDVLGQYNQSVIRLEQILGLP
ncbi:CusA/CzcA family heavy metal efflux RND transporter [Spirosoma sordidisoli]|uniref:CusA/CzcA family heavy metal efflux RND transporter n=1 Tax=Spirosoma sordidisoli TaxID=2502893 RepID=A0A4V1RVE2_9BACT|nr:CusA/CzcA family heavy metal efflux RND transporter [Spirosoma sordidisoli]RYC66458.1 CusA/CzcA family heavy metal efflux RND transporter [Spirosoma sordidisoli]